MVHLRVLVIGESWHGSNCTALASGFRELGHTVSLVGINEFMPRTRRKLVPLVLARLARPILVREFNADIVSQLRTRRPDLAVVYKGNWVTIETLRGVRESGAWLCNMYPDVSMFGHQGLDPRSFLEYQHIFTTKSFGVGDLERHFGVRSASFLPHGFDPIVHRRLPVPQDTDVSFIGTWSPHKEALLSDLVSAIGAGRLAVWGTQWEKARSGSLRPSLKFQPVLGDHYAEAISRSKINLGILSERRAGASSGDLSTARTFEIPACGGFLLHQRTDELLGLFREGTDVACFESSGELIERVRYYLAHEDERRSIAAAGEAACRTNHSYTHRAQAIVSEFLSAREGRGTEG